MKVRCRITWLMILLLPLLLSACTARMVYSKLDWIVLNFVDDYVSLTEQQENFLEHSLVDVIAWHKESELPRYIDYIDRQFALTPEQSSVVHLQQQLDEIRAAIIRIGEKIEPIAYAIFMDLSELQGEELLTNLAKKHRKQAQKYQELTLQQVRESYQQRMTKRLETWFDELTPQQTLTIQQWSQQVHMSHDLWQIHQQQMRERLKQLLAQRQGTVEFRRRFQQLFLRSGDFYSASLQQQLAANQQLTLVAVNDVVQSLTPQQVKFYRQQLQDWRQVMVDLQQ